MTLTADPQALLRALRRAVYTDKMLTLDDAWKILDLHGIPRDALDQTA